MKRFAKIFLLFVFIMTSSFSFVGCGRYDRVNGSYYFNREYYYNDNKTEIIENSILYGEYYDTSIRIFSDQFSMRFRDGLAVFKLNRQSLKIVDTIEIKTYELELVSYTYDEIEEGETPEMPVISNIYMEISPNGAIITMPWEEKTIILEFLKDPSKVVRHNYKLNNYVYRYVDGSTENLNNNKFNNFVDIDSNKMICYKDGVKYEYNTIYNSENDEYSLTLLTATGDALFETATMQILENKIKIKFSNENIESGVLTYNKLFVTSYPSDGGGDTNVEIDKDGVSNDDIEILAENAYIKIIKIVKIILPTFIGVIVAFGLFYGIQLGVKYAKAEEVEDKKKVKSSLISVIVACVIVIVIVSIVMLLI